MKIENILKGTATTKNKLQIDDQIVNLYHREPDLVIGEEYRFVIKNEYPECSESHFCESDITCIECLQNNRVACLVSN